MEQTKTDPGRKKKKPLRRCGIFFACLLFLFLCSFVYISKNPRARMLLSVIYFMQDTLKDPAYIAYHIDIMELCQDYFNGDISFEGKAYLNDIKNFKYSSSMDISGERSFTQKKLSIISDMDVLTLNVGEMDFYMNPNTVYFMVPMLDNLSYAMTTGNTYFKKAPELTHDIDQEWFHDNFSNIIELTRQIQIEETGKTRTDSDDVKSHEYLVTIPEGSGDFIWELLGMDAPDYDIRISLYLTGLCRMSRMEIQTGYSYGYPMSVVSAHVSSCPNHQTLRMTPLETRFQVAAFGICGYECNFCDMKKEDFDTVKAQIALYKEWRKVLQTGSFYRGRNFSDQGSVLGSSAGNIQEWTCVSEDREKAVGFLMQKLVSPNTQFEYYRPNGLNPEARYHFYNRSLKYNVKEFGDLVNTVAPVHIRQDSVAHNLIAKFVKMDGEAEDFCAYGDALMYAGVKLKQAFGGTGYNEQIRHFPDFASRMYFMEQMND